MILVQCNVLRMMCLSREGLEMAVQRNAVRQYSFHGNSDRTVKMFRLSEIGCPVKITLVNKNKIEMASRSQKSFYF